MTRGWDHQHRHIQKQYVLASFLPGSRRSRTLCYPGPASPACVKACPVPSHVSYKCSQCHHPAPRGHNPTWSMPGTDPWHPPRASRRPTPTQPWYCTSWLRRGADASQVVDRSITSSGNAGVHVMLPSCRQLLGSVAAMVSCLVVSRLSHAASQPTAGQPGTSRSLCNTFPLGRQP
ncbi:hypothetical protein GWK47_031295 [Chionoecetes opilio]|uniref:Uncharacterized protein n=1 Tax=Chionoecetes opilio TaxID=41210 RepID=A0A8J4YJK7_CHIOP|nr:hypothetical protein GWK47_031295 [Chionoecetes opilio]